MHHSNNIIRFFVLQLSECSARSDCIVLIMAVSCAAC
jgi:hypothetical protein